MPQRDQAQARAPARAPALRHGGLILYGGLLARGLGRSFIGLGSGRLVDRRERRLFRRSLGHRIVRNRRLVGCLRLIRLGIEDGSFSRSPRLNRGLLRGGTREVGVAWARRGTECLVLQFLELLFVHAGMALQLEVLAYGVVEDSHRA